MQALSRKILWSTPQSAGALTGRAVVAANRIVRSKSTVGATAAYDQTVETFPSIVIGPNKAIVPQGSFAEAQAQFLDPDPDAVAELSDGLLRANMGVVAHYYMDVELQGVLTAVQRSHPDLQHRVGIADSLRMGDIAVDMCRNPDSSVTAVACLGVDFMSESVSAILDRNGLGHVPVYRATPSAIGCSLAESAERDSYQAWLRTAKETANAALHVVYINTSLETKAVSTSIVPTITCTSSNVLQTILQASAQVGPDLKLLYGPDTYMGENLVSMLRAVLSSTSPDGGANAWDDARIAKELHHAHTRKSLQDLLDNMDVYPHGNCVVHHMFGSEVVDAVKRNYDDAFVTAHLEVPGEMFEIAMERSMEGRGVVGSTSDILKFITAKVDESAKKLGSAANGKRLKFILGTEAGMVTSIVKSVQDILDATGSDVEAEIIFPVSSNAVMGVEGDDATNLAVVPGAGGGEGCSTAGGCATCPFMKMNDLNALQDVIEMTERANAGSSKDQLLLRSHLPPDRLRGKQIGGVNAIDLGVEPIMYMREFMQNKAISDELMTKVRNLS